MALVQRANSGPSSPAKFSDRVAREPAPAGTTKCRAVTSRPGARLTQVKLASRTSVTVHKAGGNFGWRIHARLPTFSGPRSVSLTLVTDAVHSCHFSTSLITAQTREGGASMSTLMLKSTSHMLLDRLFVFLGPLPSTLGAPPDPHEKRCECEDENERPGRGRTRRLRHPAGPAAVGPPRIAGGGVRCDAGLDRESTIE